MASPRPIRPLHPRVGEFSVSWEAFVNHRSDAAADVLARRPRRSSTAICRRSHSSAGCRARSCTTTPGLRWRRSAVTESVQSVANKEGQSQWRYSDSRCGGRWPHDDPRSAGEKRLVTGRFDKRVAVVTGAASGIGAATPSSPCSPIRPKPNVSTCCSADDA